MLFLLKLCVHNILFILSTDADCFIFLSKNHGIISLPKFYVRSWDSFHSPVWEVCACVCVCPWRWSSLSSTGMFAMCSEKKIGSSIPRVFAQACCGPPTGWGLDRLHSLDHVTKLCAWGFCCLWVNEKWSEIEGIYVVIGNKPGGKSEGRPYVSS